MRISFVTKAIAALKRLRDDEKLRQAMVENGYIRAQERSTK
ncbi:hypothetical protein [Calothrix sp. 336/3]|nr:hypothetical protein [Calothrix sp. 336/3]